MACGGPAAKEPTTYTPEIMQRVELYSPGVAELRNRFPELEQYIQAKDWVDVQSFIHGPMGELRARVNRLASSLLTKDQPQAKELAQELYSHLERLDEASSARPAGNCRSGVPQCPGRLRQLPESGANVSTRVPN